MYRRKRRLVAVVVFSLFLVITIYAHPHFYQTPAKPQTLAFSGSNKTAMNALSLLSIKSIDTSTEYRRSSFGPGWADIQGCTMRNIILNRDLAEVVVGDDCKVVRGVLSDPYTGKTIQFMRGASTSDKVQIDHVVALSNAWHTGAQYLTKKQRERFANDPLELLAVDGVANQDKGGKSADNWLPPHESFRCSYVARQIAIKQKYQLWVTQAEYAVMNKTLQTCPEQILPVK